VTGQIAEPLSTLATPIDNLTLDSENARRGDVAAVRRSLTVFGQRKPVVVRRTGHDEAGRATGVVMAGNTTVQAARELGWHAVAALFLDDDETTARAYALADNRTGELATWDHERLADTLRELGAAEFDVDALGWTDEELARLMAGAEFLPDADAEEPRLDQRKATMCPKCAFEWRMGPNGEIEPV
jgi:ParB-like chromosome segregation protein Spo0J